MKLPMIQTSLLAIGLCATSLLAQDDPDFGFNFMTVGDVGNIPYTGGPDDVNAGRGSVDYEYRVAQTEITTGQWLAFYHTFSVQSDELADLLEPIWACRRDDSYAGPGRRFVLNPIHLRPEISPVGVSWRQAAMLCNWLHNGQSSHPESLRNGAYDIETFTENEDGTFNDQDARSPGARFWIPNLDEFLKAGYYDPDKEGNGPGWWLYGYSSDTPPVHGLPGVGHVARELSDEQLIELAGTIAENYIPLGIYPEVQSPWGLLDLLGGRTEFVEDWQFPEFKVWRFMKSASNIVFSSPWDEVWHFVGFPPQAHVGARIVSAVYPQADLNQDWHVNYFDVSVFIKRFMAGDLSVDFTDDGSLDIEDVSIFLQMFNEN